MTKFFKTIINFFTSIGNFFKSIINFFQEFFELLGGINDLFADIFALPVIGWALLTITILVIAFIIIDLLRDFL